MELDIVPFQARLEKTAYNNHIHVVQFANIENLNNSSLKNFKRAMVIGQSFNNELMEKFNKDVFNFHIDLIKNHLSSVAYKIYNFLSIEGYTSMIIPPMFLKGDNELHDNNKIIAKLAGVGNIGKKGFFVSPTYGVRIILCSILTEAPLEYDNEYKIDLCKQCSICDNNEYNKAIILCPYGKNKYKG
jgi:hypothetical protein